MSDSTRRTFTRFEYDWKHPRYTERIHARRDSDCATATLSIGQNEPDQRVVVINLDLYRDELKSLFVLLGNMLDDWNE